MPYSELKKGRSSENHRIYFVTATTYNRIPHFRDFLIARKLIQVMRNIESNEVADFLAWVIMLDHAHWLIQTKSNSSLSKVINYLKGTSARIINQEFGKTGRFWQPNFYDHGLRKEEDIKQIAKYIIANPLRANLVVDIREYSHWDAKWI